MDLVGLVLGRNLGVEEDTDFALHCRHPRQEDLIVHDKVSIVSDSSNAVENAQAIAFLGKVFPLFSAVAFL